MKKTALTYGERSVEVFYPDHFVGDIIESYWRHGRFYETQVRFRGGQRSPVGLLDDLYRRYDGEAFIDVGACVGNHTLFAAGILGAEVFAFEPNLEARRILKAALLTNGLSSRVRLYDAALSDARGRARYVEGPALNLGMGRIELCEEGDVRVLTLDEAFSPSGRPLGISPGAGSPLPRGFILKIDAEGFEARILRGGAAFIERHRPKIYAEAPTEEAFAALFAALPGAYRVEGARLNPTPTFLFVYDA